MSGAGEGYSNVIQAKPRTGEIVAEVTPQGQIVGKTGRQRLSFGTWTGLTTLAVGGPLLACWICNGEMPEMPTISWGSGTPSDAPAVTYQPAPVNDDPTSKAAPCGYGKEIQFNGALDYDTQAMVSSKDGFWGRNLQYIDPSVEGEDFDRNGRDDGTLGQRVDMRLRNLGLDAGDRVIFEDEEGKRVEAIVNSAGGIDSRYESAINRAFVADCATDKFDRINVTVQEGFRQGSHPFLTREFVGNDGKIEMIVMPWDDDSKSYEVLTQKDGKGAYFEHGITPTPFSGTYQLDGRDDWDKIRTNKTPGGLEGNISDFVANQTGAKGKGSFWEFFRFGEHEMRQRVLTDDVSIGMDTYNAANKLVEQGRELGIEVQTTRLYDLITSGRVNLSETVEYLVNNPKVDNDHIAEGFIEIGAREARLDARLEVGEKEVLERYNAIRDKDSVRGALTRELDRLKDAALADGQITGAEAKRLAEQSYAVVDRYLTEGVIRGRQY